MFDGISVWLDELAPNFGAFAHALEWASRLKLPLRGVVLASPPAVAAEGACRPAPEVRLLQACAECCRRQHVSWEGAVWQGAPALCVHDFLVDGRLCVYGQSLPPARKDELLYWSLRNQHVASLVCPNTWSPLSRMLLLNQGTNLDDPFLRIATDVGRAFQTIPVVLTVARSEPDARARQRQAQEMFAEQQATADFDFVVGCDIRAAVALEAHVRRCSHVFIARQAARWWRWPRAEPLLRLLDLPAPLTYFSSSNNLAVAVANPSTRRSVACG